MVQRYSSFKNQVIDFEAIFKPEVYDEFSKKLYAHTSESKRPETICEHAEKTLEIFQKILNELAICPIINQLLADLYDELGTQETGLDKSEFKSIIWRIIVNSVYYHDIGKINPKYQKIKLNNENKLQYFHKDFADTEHSKYSMYFLNVIVLKELEKFDGKWETFYKLFYVASTLMSIVDRHHSKLDDVEELLKKMANQTDSYVMNFLKTILTVANRYKLDEVLYNTNDFITRKDRKGGFKLKHDTTLFFLYKLLYSLLVTADYYSTLCYKEDILPQEIKLNYLTDGIIRNIEVNFYNNKPFNRKLKSLQEVERLRSRKIEEMNNLNELRSTILIEASDTLSRYLEKDNVRIFFLNVPTGGGKTNVSMKLLIDMLTHHNVKNIKRAYYVFPYVNIIEQNYEVLVETLTSNKEPKIQDIISKIYSYNEWDFSLEDGKEELEYYINQQFLNTPINVISNVNFFNTFLKNGKKINYKTANLANSIIILDEVQSIPTSMWKYLSELINDIAEKYNTYFILMSATLPDLSRFLDEKSREIIVELIEKPERYQNHKCFKRTAIKFDIDEKRDIKDDKFVDSYFINKIKDEKERVSDSKIKALCVVNTVKNSYLLFNKLSKKLKENGFEDDFDIFLLNSTILSPRRQQIIAIFNRNLMNLEKNIILVSTQSVEAGVDIDCNFGFREISPIDSIEQISGRINREGKRKIEESRLYIFDLDTSKYVYKEDYRQKVQKKYNPAELEDMINNKKFIEFYNKVIDYINAEEADIAREYNELIKPTCSLKFKQLATQDYIDADNVTLFVPLDLDLQLFPITEGEKKYLKECGIKVTRHLRGEDVWNLYKKVLSGDRFNKNVFLEAKKLQSILNRFTFSLTNRRIKKTTSLIDFIQNLVNSGQFESMGGIVKVNKKFLEVTNYSIDYGLNLDNLEIFYNVSMENII